MVILRDLNMLVARLDLWLSSQSLLKLALIFTPLLALTMTAVALSGL
jgi:hypothetical protein